MVTSFLCLFEKGRQAVAKLLQRAEPRVENRSPLVGEGVRPLRGPWKVSSPLGDDEPLVLERSERPVDVADVDTIVAGELGEPLEELVPMGRAVRDEHEKSGLAEALDARANLPASVREPSAAAHSGPVTTVHVLTICELHM
jgi:hypothetical protein